MTETKETTITRIKEVQAPKYAVLIHNDDITPFAFVAILLMDIFGHTQDSALDVTDQIHNNGLGRAGTYSYELAEQKLHEAKTVVMYSGYPLRVTVEQA